MSEVCGEKWEVSFDAFWAMWPDNGSDKYEEYSRKKDKKKCAELWDKTKLDRHAAVILRDVEVRKRYDKGWLGQRGSFLCAPLVYLRNERWNDGTFADVRKDRPKDLPSTTVARPEDDGPDLSRWARCANKVLLHLAYFDERRGFNPVGEELLKRLIAAKNDFVQMAEEADRAGQRMGDQEFVDMCIEGLETVLGLRHSAEAQAA